MAAAEGFLEEVVGVVGEVLVNVRLQSGFPRHLWVPWYERNFLELFKNIRRGFLCSGAPGLLEGPDLGLGSDHV